MKKTFTMCNVHVLLIDMNFPYVQWTSAPPAQFTLCFVNSTWFPKTFPLFRILSFNFFHIIFLQIHLMCISAFNMMSLSIQSLCPILYTFSTCLFQLINWQYYSYFPAFYIYMHPVNEMLIDSIKKASYAKTNHYNMWHSQSFISIFLYSVVDYCDLILKVDLRLIVNT
jgi:hypothetical protein